VRVDVEDRNKWETKATGNNEKKMQADETFKTLQMVFI
jgi:hypothetical protein